MDNSVEPLICISLRHPPQQQLFFRLKEIPSVFLEQLDRLYFALQAAQARYPSSEAMQILQQVRTLAGDKAHMLSKTVLSAPETAARYIKLLKALQNQENHRSALFSVKSSATTSAGETGKSLQAMNEFREGLGDAVSRITTIMNAKRKWRTKPPVFATENMQAISEIYSAIDECNGILQECREYFEEMMKQASNEDVFETNPPSEGEIQVMREKWEAFVSVTDSADLIIGWTAMRDSLQTPPDQSRRLPVSAAAVASSQPSPTNESSLSTIWQKVFRHSSRNQPKNANSNPGGQRNPNISNAPSNERSPKLSSRRKAFWRPTCLSTKTFH